jgi:hypothetical protein
MSHQRVDKSDDDECLYEPTRAFLHSEHEPERGSHAADELRLDKAEAMRSFVWLRESHPEWLKRVADASGLSQQAYIAQLTAYLTDKGRGSVARARCAVKAYEAFATRAAKHVATPYPCTAAKMAMYLRDCTESARREARKKNRTFKGYAATGRARGLRYAADYFGAPFDAARSDMAKVGASAPEVTTVARDEAHMPAYVQCHLESLASSEWFREEHPVAWEDACAFAASGLLAIRG